MIKIKNLNNKNKMSVLLFIIWLCCVLRCFLPMDYSAGDIVNAIFNVVMYTGLYVFYGRLAYIDEDLKKLIARHNGGGDYYIGK